MHIARLPFYLNLKPKFNNAIIQCNAIISKIYVHDILQ